MQRLAEKRKPKPAAPLKINVTGGGTETVEIEATVTGGGVETTPVQASCVEPDPAVLKFPTKLTLNAQGEAPDVATALDLIEETLGFFRRNGGPYDMLLQRVVSTQRALALVRAAVGKSPG
jgi:hypothetical protein